MVFVGSKGNLDILGHIQDYKVYGEMDTVYWFDPIRRIEFESASIVVEIDLEQGIFHRLPSFLETKDWRGSLMYPRSSCSISHLEKFVRRTPCHALPETRDKQSVGFVPKEGRKNFARKSIFSDSVPDDRYAISNGSGYAVLICWDEYDVLDRELDMPYPMEVDTPYSTIYQKSVYREYDLAHLKLVFEFSIYKVWKSVEYGVSNGLDTAYWGFLGARIRRIFLMDMAYWSSE
ncbi:hypothetical protein Tco_0013692 [Tanacetum coccineum]